MVRLGEVGAAGRRTLRDVSARRGARGPMRAGVVFAPKVSAAVAAALEDSRQIARPAATCRTRARRAARAS